MPGAFGLLDGYHPTYFPAARIIEHVPHLDIRMLARCGALVTGTTTKVAIESESESTGAGPGAVRALTICREGPGVTINGVLVRLSWDEAFGRERPWFECPRCSQRCRHVYLCDTIGCRRCCKLDYSSRHIGRQMPSAARASRLRRRLGCDDLRPFAPLPPRRRGQRRAHYQQLIRQIHEEEAKLVAYLGSIVYDLSRRQRVRRGRKRRDATKASTLRADPASS